MNRLLTDTAVFDDAWLPQQLVHRDPEQGQLARAFEPAFSGDRPRDVCLHGPHGVGKSVLVRHTLDRLAPRGEIASAVVECMGLTTAGIMRATLRGLGLADPAQTTPLEDLCLALRDGLDEPAIVVLDEADDVPTTDALARLWDVPRLGIVAICHDRERWVAQLDADHRQRIRHAADIHLQRYHVDELVDILRPRARQGLAAGVVDEDQLARIADEAAGVARMAITALHAAATVAGERGGDRIRERDIAPGFERARRWVRESNLASLSFHHQVLYELVRQAGEIRPQALQDRYDAVADEVYHGFDQTPLSSTRSRRYKLEKLQEYDLIAFEGTNQYDAYEPCDAGVAPAVDLTIPSPAE